jgi:hypothetical protein
VKKLFALLALVVCFALHKRPPGGGGDGPNKPPGRPGDGSGKKPSQQHGKIDASSGVSKAQDATGEVAQKGRPAEKGTGEQPGRTGTPKDPAGGKVTHGKNSLGHMRQHAQHIRTAAREDGVEIPTGVGKPETQQAIKDYIQRVVDNPDQVGVGRYMSVENAIWSRRGDLIIVRKPDGEWITALSVKSGGAAGGAPWSNPSPSGN